MNFYYYLFVSYYWMLGALYAFCPYKYFLPACTLFCISLNSVIDSFWFFFFLSFKKNLMTREDLNYSDFNLHSHFPLWLIKSHFLDVIPKNLYLKKKKNFMWFSSWFNISLLKEGQPRVSQGIFWNRPLAI